MKTITINTEYITLGQFLKLADCISTGGEAKFFVKEATIRVNDVPENRRGRKLYAQDQVAVDGYGTFLVARQG
ncbi:S4 domain-containing protein YaaA [Paenibacillus hodogayensis]|uniref:S4 domain-containing protein YaaA n=1 Tax=Paenibacillus hodogayensis TaxID=279208 RepID=A0ABV5W0B2_9BACL